MKQFQGVREAMPKVRNTAYNNGSLFLLRILILGSDWESDI